MGDQGNIGLKDASGGNGRPKKAWPNCRQKEAVGWQGTSEGLPRGKANGPWKKDQAGTDHQDTRRGVLPNQWTGPSACKKNHEKKPTFLS